MAEAGPQTHPEDRKYCPMLGMVAIPAMKRAIASLGPEMTINIQMSGCVESQCMLWDEQKKNCLVKAGLESIANVAALVDANKGKLSSLSALSGLFGKKKE